MQVTGFSVLPGGMEADFKQQHPICAISIVLFKSCLMAYTFGTIHWCRSQGVCNYIGAIAHHYFTLGGGNRECL